MFNFLNDKTSRQEINDLLSVPHFTRAELLNFTSPRIDSNNFANWVRRGFFEKHLSVGTAKELRAAAQTIETNEGLAEGRRRYTGSDMLRIAVLSTLSKAGLPLALHEEVTEIALHRAVSVSMHQVPDELILIITGDQFTGYRITEGNFKTLEFEEYDSIKHIGEWFTIINVDSVIHRFLTIAWKKKGRDTDRP